MESIFAGGLLVLAALIVIWVAFFKVSEWEDGIGFKILLALFCSLFISMIFSIGVGSILSGIQTKTREEIFSQKYKVLETVGVRGNEWVYDRTYKCITEEDNIIYLKEDYIVITKEEFERDK